MSDEKKAPDSGKNTWDFLDVVTGKIGKITLLVGAVSALLTQVYPLIQGGSSLVKSEPEQRPPLEGCLKPKLIVPKTVSISEWDSMMLKLKGRNDCPQSLNIYVTFKAAGESVLIVPTMGDECRSQPECWEQKSLDSGDLDQIFTRPRLRFLKKPLGNPVKLSINWVVYNVHDNKILRADTAQITLRDDPESMGSGAGN